MLNIIKRVLRRAAGKIHVDQRMLGAQSTICYGENRHYGLGTPSFKIINNCSVPTLLYRQTTTAGKLKK